MAWWEVALQRRAGGLHGAPEREEAVRAPWRDPTEGIHVLLGFLQPQLLVLWPSSMLGPNNKVCCTRLPDQAMKMLCPTNCKHLPCVRLGQASVPLSMLTPALWTEPAQNRELTADRVARAQKRQCTRAQPCHQPQTLPLAGTARCAGGT